MKMLTVSIAAYNDEKYIRETIDSLICEDIMDKIEILVCDDGGTDSTLDIVKEYSEKYPDSVIGVHKENGGYGSVINKNVQLARGKYFKQLDGDDWFVTKNLPAFIKLLSEIDADCVITPFELLHMDSGERGKVNNFKYLKEGKYFFNKVDFQNVTTMYESTFRTEVLKKMQLHITEHCFYTDIEYINLPLPYLESFYVSNITIYVYRLGIEGQSVSTAGVKKHYKEHEKVFWNLVALYGSLDETQTAKKKLLMFRLRKEFAKHLKFYCMLPKNSQNLKAMKSFSAQVKQNYPVIYQEAIAYSRFAKLLTKSNFLVYPFTGLFIK